MYACVLVEIDVIKVKNIGDAIMCCCGLLGEKDHALRMVRYGLGLIHIIEKYNTEHGHPIDVRVGINSGPLVAGVVGKKTPLLDLFGDAVVCFVLSPSFSLFPRTLILFHS
jgi:adenylate cyclase